MSSINFSRDTDSADYLNAIRKEIAQSKAKDVKSTAPLEYILDFYNSVNISNSVTVGEDTIFAHWDMSVLSSITKDGANRISQINDQIGTNHLVQATGGNQPLWVDNGQNGKDTCDLSGSRFMRVTFGSSKTIPLTIIIAMKLMSTSGGTKIFMREDVSTEVDIGKDASDNISGQLGGGIASFAGGADLNTWVVLTLIGTSSYTKIRIDGVEKASSTAASVGGLTGLTVGISQIDTLGSNNIWGEIRIYTSELTGSRLTGVENSMMAKWAT